MQGYTQTRTLKITKPYLNIPVGNQARMKLVKILVAGKLQREFPVQLAEETVNYWIYIDVSEFMGKEITFLCPATSHDIGRIYQDQEINGADSLYTESNRPQVHFTVKRGWSNDINGPIFYHGVYHLFWQAFPFGNNWNTGFMYWGHATSKDLLHWEEKPPAMMLDSLGSPWSGTAVIDHNNDGGFGKDALVLYYTAFDRISSKQVQCIAYSNDGGKTFQRFKGNPVIDSNNELNSTSTRDPKVFWYAPAKTWVMVLFEVDGLSFFNSSDMKTWKRESHFVGLHECPDFFELPIDGDQTHTKWVLHGGSSDYYIGTFDGKKFTAESPRLQYAEGKNWNGEDMLYAAESFENMPDNRRVQIAWGRAQHPGMPFTQMMLFPTEFALITTPQGIRMVATPIREIANLHDASHHWTNLRVADANRKLQTIPPGPLHVRLICTTLPGNDIRLRYMDEQILDLPQDSPHPRKDTIELIIDKTTAEIFINNGKRYIIKNLKGSSSKTGLVFDGEQYGPSVIETLDVFTLRSIWKQ